MLEVSNGTQPAEVDLNREWQGTELALIIGVQGGSRVVNHNVVSFFIACRFPFLFCFVLFCVCASAFVNSLFDLFCF